MLELCVVIIGAVEIAGDQPEYRDCARAPVLHHLLEMPGPAEGRGENAPIAGLSFPRRRRHDTLPDSTHSGDDRPTCNGESVATWPHARALSWRVPLHRVIRGLITSSRW